MSVTSLDHVSSYAARAGRKQWSGLAVLSLPCMLYAMDLTILNLALPRITADLQPTSTQLLWIVDIYGFLLAGLLIPMGALGDRIGRRKLLLIGAAAFGLGSILAALSTSASMLIATRALLGIAGATLAPSTLSLIRSMFLDARQRTVAIGFWITSYSVGAVIGPLVGGVVLEHFSWQAAFLTGVPVMLLLLAVGPVLLPEFRDPSAARPDLFSAGLSLAAVLATIYGLKQIAQDGMTAFAALPIVAGVAVAALFVQRQRRISNPLLDLRLFASRAFSASLATYTLATFLAFGMFLFVTQYLQLVLGLSPLQAGLSTVPSFGGFILGSLVTPHVVRRVRPAFVMAAGLGVAAVGVVLLSQVGLGLAVIVIGDAVFSVGLAPVFTLATDMIVGSAPPERAGAAAAISETGSEFGGALGIAVLGSIGSAVYRSVVASALPVGVVSNVPDTLGGTVQFASMLPDDARALLLDSAHQAFAQGIELTALLSAVLTIALAFAAGIMLRQVPAASGAH